MRCEDVTSFCSPNPSNKAQHSIVTAHHSGLTVNLGLSVERAINYAIGADASLIDKSSEKRQIFIFVIS